MRLPTNPDMLAVVRSLEGIRTDQGNIGGGRDGDGAAGATKWKALLGPPGSHKMLYTLQIIEGVLESVAGYDGRGKGDLLCSSEVERGGVDRVRWATEFVRSQGFAQLCEAVLTPGLFGDEHPRSMVDVQQACLVRRACLWGRWGGGLSFDFALRAAARKRFFVPNLAVVVFIVAAIRALDVGNLRKVRCDQFPAKKFHKDPKML